MKWYHYAFAVFLLTVSFFVLSVTLRSCRTPKQIETLKTSIQTNEDSAQAIQQRRDLNNAAPITTDADRNKKLESANSKNGFHLHTGRKQSRD